MKNTPDTILPTYKPNEASIYLHIPFCRKACTYCNFHFSTSLHHKTDLIKAILTELDVRKDYLSGKLISTIYFGGGTPSVLDASELGDILDKIRQHYSVKPNVEITFEANPDDISVEYLKMLQRHGVNRLSIGLQSFHEEELTWMNRSHNASQSIAILELLEAMPEFDYSVDLIFGLPISNHAKWQENLQILAQYRVPHVSCYNLTIEPKTPLAHQVKQKLSPAIDDEMSAEQYQMTHDVLTTKGYEHYEVSNYAKPGKYSRHNTGYWFGAHYLGIGPAAHSFDTHSRSWNVANNAHYIQGLASGKSVHEVEILSGIDKHNESVMTSLRTWWGLDMHIGLTVHEVNLIKGFCQQGLANIVSDRLVLTEEGRLHCDSLASQLFR